MSFERDKPRKPFPGLAAMVGAVLALGGCGGNQASTPVTKPAVTVAAAANLTEVFQQIGPQFEARTGIHPVFSFASTAQLTQQIENGAPFDVFAAADATHLADLDRKGLLLAGSRVVYARGVLALWIPPGSQAHVARIQDLAASDVRFVAVAKPELAPYGEAAVEALRRLGLWEQVQPKIVYAENISMARQYGQSHNADAVFTAYSLVQHESGQVIRVEEAVHAPIDQELGILANSEHSREARQFADFLLHGEGRSTLLSYGYQLPGSY